MSRASRLFSIPAPTTKNRDGFAAYERPLEEQYLQTLLTNTVGNTFYADKEELLQEAGAIHDAMLTKDPAFAARAIVFARNEGFMRLQPIFGLAKLSGVDVGLFEAAFPKVVLIPPDLQDFLVILRGMGRGEGGRAVKRAVSAFLNGISEYWAVKYNGRGRGYSLGDAVRTAHPKPKDEKQEALFAYLVGGACDFLLLPQVAAFEGFKKASTDEERVRFIREGKLPHEVVTGVGKLSETVWKAILHEMPVFALLRHLNALDRAGVLDDEREFVASRLTDRDALRKSKILPFRFLGAFEKVEKGWVKDILREAVELTFENLPEIPGKTAVFLDVSGSMAGGYLRIGSVFGLALYKKTRGNGLFWTFDTEVYDPRASLHDSILSQAERIGARGGTDTGAPIRKLRHWGMKVDNIIVITDEQQNTGSPFYRELVEYRRTVNGEVKAFVVDVAPYRSAMVPPEDRNTWYIYGWSDTVLSYIALSCRGYGGMVQKVKETSL